MKHFAVIVWKQNQHKIFTSVFIFGTLYFFTIAFSLCKNYPLDRRQRRRTMTLRTLYRYMGALTRPQPRILRSTQLSGTSHCRGRLVVDPAQSTPKGVLCATGGCYPPLRFERENWFHSLDSSVTEAGGSTTSRPLQGVLPFNQSPIKSNDF